MAGWDLKNGIITEENVSDDRYWSLFNYVFSDTCMKRNTYKYGLIKAILDNLLNVYPTDNGLSLSYADIFEKFTENYWNLVLKYDLHQMRRDGKSEISKIEEILKNEAKCNTILPNIEFCSLEEVHKSQIIKRVMIACKRNVVGALYQDFEGTLYAFDIKANGIVINESAYNFMLKYKMELERLNYYSWAKFLERINTENALIKVIGKLELSTPQRTNLSIYREILRSEFEEENCFYCGRKLNRDIHVDHFIPWSFTKENKIWNFVLTCPSCNIKKSNNLANATFIPIIKERNNRMLISKNSIIKRDYLSYRVDLIDCLWAYAKQSGLKVLK